MNWLLAKPTLFKAGSHDVAHWGLIEADSTYGGEKKKVRGAPAGPTALALYALLKCGVDPEHPVIEHGFNWLREPHPATNKWDGLESGSDSIRLFEVSDSYELSMIILALTAKYDRYKQTAKSTEAARKGKLKIKNRSDRKWLQAMVASLVDRRRIPGGQARRGWRYNTYYLYALERAMDLLGKQLVGDNLWYEEGAEQLLRRQNRVQVEVPGKKEKRRAPGVYWNTGTTHVPMDVLDTCFALLFLKRATRGMVPRAAVTGGG